MKVRLPLVFLFLLLLSFPSFAWWNPDWKYRKIVFVTNPNDFSVYNVTVSVVLDNETFNFSRARSDLGDIRFIWNDDLTKLSYALVEYNETEKKAIFYVKIPELPPTSQVATTFYMYFGNPNATYEGNLEILTKMIGQTGTIETTSTDWITVNFTYPFDEIPVVLASLQFQDTNQMVARIKDISRYGFRVRAEPYQGYPAGTPIRIFWMAFRKGQYYIGEISDDGKPHLVVDTGITSSNENPIYFPSKLSAAYVVLADINSYNEPDEGSHVRITDTSPDRFYVRIDELNAGDPHVSETIGYIAIKKGTFWIENGIIFSDRERKVGNSLVTTYFPVEFSQIPTVILDSQQEFDADTGTAVVWDITTSHVTYRFVESPSGNNNHKKEFVGLLVTNSSVVWAYGAVPDGEAILSYVDEEYQTPVPLYVRFAFINPSYPVTTDDLVCITSASIDPDYYLFKWYINGALVLEVNTTNYYSTLSSSYTSKHDNVTCESYFYYDGIESSHYNYTVQIFNSPPSTPTELQPASGLFGGIYDTINITCGGSSDVDGDSLLYYIKVLYNGYWHLFNTTDGKYILNVSDVPSQTNVDVICYAFDYDDGYSDRFNPEGTLSIDNDKPLTSSSYPNNTWSNGDVVVELYCSDNYNNCSIYYCVSNAPCEPNTPYSSPIVITSEGVWYVGFTSYDSVYNKDLDRYTIVKIDKTPPSVHVISPEQNKTYIASAAIAFIYDDNFGVSDCWYEIEGDNRVYELVNCSNSTYEAVGGNVTMYLFVSDYAGNINVTKINFKFVPLLEMLSAGGGGGGSTIIYVNLYVKIPFLPPVDAKLCIDDECKTLKPIRGVAKETLTLSEYKKAILIAKYGFNEKKIPLAKEYGIRSNLFVDVGELFGLRGALYFQEEQTDFESKESYAAALFIGAMIGIYFLSKRRKQ